MASPTASRESATSKDDESGVAAGITVLILTVPLLLISALGFYSGRLAQTDNHLSWAVTSAARAGANCRTSIAAAETRPCTIREATLTIEKTVRAILLENRRLFCLNSGATGMRVEYQDRDGSLIYAYLIGSLLLNSRYWPDRGGEIPEVGSDENPDDSPNYTPVQPNNLRRDFNGDELFLESSEGVIEILRADPNDPSDPNYSSVVRARARGGEIVEVDPGDPSATPPEPPTLEVRESNPEVFATTMDAPLGSTTPVSRIAVHLICDFTGGSTGLLAQASTREASATAIVPAEIAAESV